MNRIALALYGFLFAATIHAAELRVPADFRTIQAAVAASAQGDTILVGPGVYRESIDLMGRRITIRSVLGPDVTFLEGEGVSGSIFVADGGESRATVIQGFRLRGGAGSIRSACGWQNAPLGGAVFVLNAGLTILDCVFEHNGYKPLNRDRVVAGGAVCACSADLVVTNSRFDDNIAANGGAIFFSALAASRDLAVEGSTFTNNDAGFGGAIRHEGSRNSTGRIERSAFGKNVASHGGAVNVDLLGAGSLAIDDCTFEDNTASHGGAFRSDVRSSGKLAVTRSRFSRNVASFGGAVNVSAGDDGKVDVARSDFRENRADFGGGLFAAARASATLEDAGGTIRVTSSRFFDNASVNTEGASYVDSCYADGHQRGGLVYGGGADFRTIYGGTVTLTNSLFSGNQGALGAATHASACAGGTIDLANNTIAGNSAGTAMHVRLAKTSDTGALKRYADVRVANSIVRDNLGRALQIEQTESLAKAAITFNNIQGGFGGEGNIDAPALFVNAGARDYRLAAGSPCIDAGDNGALPDPAPTDLGGDARFADDPQTRNRGIGAGPVIDMGAYEFPAVDSRRRAVKR